MYKNDTKQKRTLSSNLEVGDLVRVVSSNRSHRFATGFTVQNTEEIFRISKIFSSNGIFTYELEDWGGEAIKGIFYRSELIPTSAPETFPIEIIKKKKEEQRTAVLSITFTGNPIQNALING